MKRSNPHGKRWHKSLFRAGFWGILNVFFEMQHQQDTKAVMPNLPYSEEKICGLPKNRLDVERAINMFKNALNADRLYMRDNYQLEG
ncbi:MAG: hypothetical protein JRN37_07745 [Nitrososphaerota archaeon]|nr:hypothetical protein [Nitrososphaerota archaeon]MDG7039025.1 hypothetical protein [Nitrososphaerota archaeon]